MTIFTLTLQPTYYNRGIFNVTVDFDRYVRRQAGPIPLVLGEGGQTIEGCIDRHSNQNGTARIFGRKVLRDWFQANFQVMDPVDVDLSWVERIHLFRYRHRR